MDSIGVLENLESLDNIGYEQLRAPIQALNIVYGDIANNESNNNYEDLIGRSGLLSIMEMNSNGRLKYKQGAVRIFHKDHLEFYSKKIATILELINDTIGIVMIYSEFIDAGVIPMALALEEAGYTRYSGSKKTDPILIGAKSNTTKSLGKYAMITGNKFYSPDNKDELSAITSYENRYGANVKVVLISRAGAEGIDFKNIRQIHIMEPWYNLSRIEQIIGRGVRNLSHCYLPFEERNVEIFMHATQTESGAPTADMYLYDLAFKKAKQIGRISRLMKETSIDCILNKEQTNFTVENMATIEGNRVIKIQTSHGEMEYHVGDRPYTAICDYQDTCEYKCRPDIEDDERLGNNQYTYSTDYISTNRAKIVERIRQLFQRQVFYHIDELINNIHKQRQYPVEQIYDALTYLIENRNEFLIDALGRKGNLINRGEIYAFQPIEIGDEGISVFDRTFPVEYKVPKVRLQLSMEMHHEDDQEIHGDDQNYVSLENSDENMNSTVDIKMNYMRYVEQIYKNVDEMYQAERDFEDKKVVPQPWTDYMYIGDLTSRLMELFQIDRDNIVKYTIHHSLESLPLYGKMVLASGIQKEVSVSNTMIDKVIEAYMKHRIHHVSGVIGASNTTYLLLPNDYGVISSYKWNSDTEMWIDTEYTDTEIIQEHIINKMKAPYEPIKSKISLLVGFMVPDHPGEKNTQYIFKVKDYTKMSKSGNAKGENVRKSGKKRTIDILQMAMQILGTKTTIDEVKEYSHISLCHLLEILLRHSNTNKSIKAMYMTPEETAILKLTAKS
jgi:hypothetical protein